MSKIKRDVVIFMLYDLGIDNVFGNSKFEGGGSLSLWKKNVCTIYLFKCHVLYFKIGGEILAFPYIGSKRYKTFQTRACLTHFKYADKMNSNEFNTQFFSQILDTKWLTYILLNF